MLKKWNKPMKLLATTIIVLIYVTTGRFRNETLKGEGKSKKPAGGLVFESAGTTEKYLGSLKTIVGYSREFALQKELEERIDCEAVGTPPSRQRQQEAEGKSPPRWKRDRKLKLFIFSAYYDQRLNPHNYVRIIGLLPRNSSFYCQVWYESRHITQKAIIQEIWSPQWGPKEKTCEEQYPAIISCIAPKLNGSSPSWVSFVNKNCSGSGRFIRVSPPPSFKLPQEKKNFVICVKPLNFTNINKKSLREWLEINRRLGAEKITIYVSNLTEFVLQNPPENEVLEKKEFPPPRSGGCSSKNFEESIWYKRKMEIIAYNDCFYSNLYHTKFVIPLDVDEIIVPKTGNNWFETFRSHFLNATLSKGIKNVWPEDIENYASFSVRNAYFFPKYPKDAIIRSLTLPKRDQKIPKVLVRALLQGKNPFLPDNIFDRTIRSYRLSPKSDSVKSFVYVPKTLSVFNHYTFHVLGNATRQFIFSANEFQLNHYRNACDPILIDGCRDFLNQVVYDDSLERFRSKKKELDSNRKEKN